MVDLNNLNSLSQQQFQALSASQIQQITASALNALDGNHYKWLLADQLAAMSPGQVSALLHPDWLSPATVTGFTAGQIPAISISWSWMNPAWLNALTPAALAAIPASSFGQIGQKTIHGLDAAHVAALTVAQLSAHDLSSSSTDTVLLALTTAQISAVDLTKLPSGLVKSLHSWQVSGLTVAQLGSKDANGVSVLADMTPFQMHSLDLSKLTTAQIQSLSAKQVAALSGTQLTATDAQGHLALLDVLATPLATSLTKSQLTYTTVLDALQAFSKTIGASGISAAQLKIFDTLVQEANTVDGATSYVGSLLNSTKNGGVTTGTSASAFNSLIGKWFLGTDNPTPLSGDHLSDNSKSPLFPADMADAYKSVCQGYYNGDCYLVAAVIETAAVNPNAVKSMISENANGTYSVGFHNQNGLLGYVTVDSQLPGYTGIRDSDGSIWAGLIEKGYIEAQANGLAYSMGGANTYNQIANGGWDAPLKSITGKSTNYAGLDSEAALSKGGATFDAVSTTLAAHEDVLFDSNKAAQGLVGGHMYAVTGIDATNNDYILVNPWGGANEKVELSAAQMFSLNPYGDEFLLSNGNGPAAAGAPVAGAPVVSAANHWMQAMATFDSGNGASLDSHFDQRSMNQPFQNANLLPHGSGAENLQSAFTHSHG